MRTHSSVLVIFLNVLHGEYFGIMTVPEDVEIIWRDKIAG